MTSALMNTYGHRDLTLVRGQGCWVWDDTDNKYLDALSGIAVCGLGHCHPAVNEAIVNQVSQLLVIMSKKHLFQVYILLMVLIGLVTSTIGTN